MACLWVDGKEHSTIRGVDQLTQDVRHLVFKILGSNKRVEQLLPSLDHGVNFTTTSAEVCVVVKRLPQVVDGFASGFGTSVDEYAYIRLSGERDLRRAWLLGRGDAHLNHFANSVEKPSMGIDLLLVLGLQN